MTHPWVFGLASEGPHVPGCPGEVVLAFVHDEVVLRPCVCAPLVRLTVDMRAIRDAGGRLRAEPELDLGWLTWRDVE